MQNWFDEVAGRIEPLDEGALKAARDKWNAVAKPIGSLGQLELMVEKIAGLTGSIDVDISRKRCAWDIVCMPHGADGRG